MTNKPRTHKPLRETGVMPYACRDCHFLAYCRDNAHECHQANPPRRKRPLPDPAEQPQLFPTHPIRE